MTAEERQAELDGMYADVSQANVLMYDIADEWPKTEYGKAARLARENAMLREQEREAAYDQMIAAIRSTLTRMEILAKIDDDRFAETYQSRALLRLALARAEQAK